MLSIWAYGVGFGRRGEASLSQERGEAKPNLPDFLR